MLLQAGCGGSVIPPFWEAEVGGSPEVRISRPAWPTWQNPISTKKKQKLPGQGGECLYSQLLRKLSWEDRLSQEAEVAVS